eukprot:2721658-Pyramimonas_sp.AAC.1
MSVTALRETRSAVDLRDLPRAPSQLSPKSSGNNCPLVVKQDARDSPDPHLEDIDAVSRVALAVLCDVVDPIREPVPAPTADLVAKEVASREAVHIDWRHDDRDIRLAVVV